MIPAEAVEAAAFQLYKIDHYGNPDAWPTGEQLAKGRSIFDPPPTLDEFKADYMREAKEALEAAAPYMVAGLRVELVNLAKDFDAAEGGTLAYTSPNGLRKNAHDQLMYIAENYLGEQPHD